MNENLINDLIDIYNHFGSEGQRLKLVEECGELFTAVKNTYFEVGGTPEEKEDAIIDESADVFIVACQHYLTNPKIRDRVDFKINRTKERIKSGYYNGR